VITRAIAFKPFLSKDYHEECTPHSDSSVEEELAKWMIKKFPSADSNTGLSAAEKVEQHLQNNPEDFELALSAAYEFVQSEGLTHYIQAIELGAAKYSLHITDKTKTVTGVNVELEAYQVGGGTGIERSKESTSKASHGHMIGDINHVSKNRGEKVVGTTLRPVFTLVTKEVTKHALQKATLRYLNRESKLIN